MHARKTPQRNRTNVNLKFHNQQKGLMLVLSSPSGAGKTSIAQGLIKADPSLRMSISVTTRPKRQNEIDGVDYNFLDVKTFKKMQQRGELLEYATVFDHLYGTPRAEVKETLTAGYDIVFDIDWQGAQQITKNAVEDVVKVFILPPTTEELEKRLKKRAQDTNKVVATRMEKASSEMTHWAEYDYVLINDNLEQTVNQVLKILVAERLRQHRQIGIEEFVKNLTRARS